MQMESHLAKPEVWIRAAGLSKYEVSSHGRMRRATPGRGVRVGTIIRGAPERQRKGYLRTSVMDDNGKQVHVSLHRLICESFHGPAPSPFHHAAHIDGVNTHNWPDNLKWATPQENEADKLKHGKRARGSVHGMAKLREDDVRFIRTCQMPPDELAARFGVTANHISSVLSGRAWKHLA